MRAVVVVAEAMRNLGSAPVRTSLIALAFAGAIAGVVAAETGAALAAIEARAGMLSEGVNVFVASSEKVPLSRVACIDLQKAEFVLRSGGVADTGGLTVEHSPGTSFRLLAVDRATPAIWSGRSASVLGAAAGGSAAEELGLGVGAVVLTSRGVLGPLEVVDVSRRNLSASRAFLVTHPPVGLIDECWIEVAETGGDIVGALQTVLGPEVEIRPLRVEGALTSDPASSFERRPTRWLWIGGVGLMVVLHWLTLWWRRAEIGLYRALGVRAPAILVMGQIEVLVLACLGGVGGGLGALAVLAARRAVAVPDLLRVTGWTSTAMMVSVVLLAPLPVPAIGRRSVASLLKDR